MSFSTFSGPVRSGTQRYGTVAGGRNTGLAVLAQSYDTGDLTGAIVGNVDTRVMNIPKGSQIVDIVIDQVVASATGTTTVSVGSTSGGAELGAAVATTAGGRFRGTATAATSASRRRSTTRRRSSTCAGPRGRASSSLPAAAWARRWRTKATPPISSGKAR